MGIGDDIRRAQRSFEETRAKEAREAMERNQRERDRVTNLFKSAQPKMKSYLLSTCGDIERLILRAVNEGRKSLVVDLPQNFYFNGEKLTISHEKYLQIMNDHYADQGVTFSLRSKDIDNSDYGTRPRWVSYIEVSW